jgi:TolA-binding protein
MPTINAEPPAAPGGGSRGTPLPGSVPHHERTVEDAIDEALAPVLQRLAKQNRRIAQLERRVDERLPGAVEKANRAFNELQRLEPQLASLEQRLEELRQRFDTRYSLHSAADAGHAASDGAAGGTAAEEPTEQAQELVEAERLIDLVRREHEQIRVRMTAISWYEDRLRKLEERMGTDGSP